MRYRMPSFDKFEEAQKAINVILMAAFAAGLYSSASSSEPVVGPLWIDGQPGFRFWLVTLGGEFWWAFFAACSTTIIWAIYQNGTLWWSPVVRLVASLLATVGAALWLFAVLLSAQYETIDGAMFVLTAPTTAAYAGMAALAVWDIAAVWEQRRAARAR
jgi:hypothetical protein